MTVPDASDGTALRSSDWLVHRTDGGLLEFDPYVFVDARLLDRVSDSLRGEDVEPTPLGVVVRSIA